MLPPRGAMPTMSSILSFNLSGNARRMLASIRKRTGGLLVKSLLGLLVISFALWGIGDIFQGPQDASVAEVAGAGIHATELQAEYARTVENMRRTLGLDAEQARSFGALDSSLQRLIDRELVRREAADAGFGAPDSEVLRMIDDNPAFHDVAGRFDRALYGAVLANNRLSPQAYEESVRDDLLRALSIDSLAVGAHPPEAAVRHLQRHEQQRRVAEALTFSLDAEAPPAPDDAGLRGFFDERRQDYMAPEYRRVSTVAIVPAAFLDEVDVSDEALREEYEYRIDEFVTPARRTVDQMVFPDRESAEEARRRLDGGADFYALGAELLDLAESDMDRGTVAEDELASEALGAAVFAIAVGESTEPLETPFGWMLLRAREAFPEETRGFDSVAHDLRLERKLTLAQDLVAELGDEFEDERAGGATLEEAARAIGLAASSVGPLDRRGRLRDQAAGAAAPPVADFLERAFAAAPQEDSPLYDTADGAYFAFRVESVTPPAERSFEDAREEAAADWRARWRRDRALERAEAAAQRLRDGETAAGLAAETGAETAITEPFMRSAQRAGNGLGPAFVAAVFALEADGVSDAIEEGGRVHVARLVEILDIDEENPDEDVRERIAERLLSGQIGDIVSGWTGALRRKHDVSVNAAALERYFGN